MSSKPSPSFIGRGSPEFDLSASELREILEQALLRIAPGTRVLAIIPDKTRDDNTNMLFPFAAEILAERSVAQFDALVAPRLGVRSEPLFGLLREFGGGNSLAEIRSVLARL